MRVFQRRRCIEGEKFVSYVGRDPDFIILGAQKGGSTSFQDALRFHPEVYMRRGEDAALESPEYDKGDYFRLRAELGRRAEPVVGIKRPSYLGKSEVPGNIARSAPQARLLAVLRNPYSRLVSAYYHYISGGFIPALPLSEGLPAIAFNHSYRNKWPRSSEIVAFGQYWSLIQRYEEVGLGDNLLVFRLEDIKAWNDQVTSQLAAHVGISRQPLVEHRFPSSNQRHPSLARAKAEGFVARHGFDYSDDGMRVYFPQFKTANLPRLALLKAGKYTIKKVPGNWWGSKDESDLSQLDRITLDWLMETYEPEILGLTRDFGSNYASWSRG
jgi:hypothetical protein